jgi:hypothetical protein
MAWKRKLELISSLATVALGVIVVIGIVYADQKTAQSLGEPAPIGKAFVIAMMLYGLPSLFVALGAFIHAMKRQPLGRMLLIASSLFLAVWFFLSLVGLAWSQWVLLSWLIVLLTGFAILTSLFSLMVGKEG